MNIPSNNYNHKVETCHGTAIISIPESADENDLLYVKESLELIVKHHFKHDISNPDKKAKNSTDYNFIVEPKQKSTEDQTDEKTDDQEENMYNCGSFDNGYCYSLGRCLTEEELHVCNYSCYCYVQNQKDKIQAFLAKPKKTLYDFMETFCDQEDEVPVDDAEYDIEIYFHLPDKNANEDDWDYLLYEFAKCLELENYDETDTSAVCHVAKCIEDHMDNIRAANLFDTDITVDKIMDRIDEITTEGKVTYDWFKQFLKALQ